MDKLALLHQKACGTFSFAIGETLKRQSALVPMDGEDSSWTSLIDGSSADVYPGNIYALAIGKAATGLAAALNDKLGTKLTASLIVVPEYMHKLALQIEGWRVFAAGHPLPTEESLAAAQAAFALLDQAEREQALVIFLISGGGSALLEWPGDPRITLADLREANRQLISCGASIAEINAVRRSFSAIKGGKLAARAPAATKVTLIVSDVNRGEESNVASGPTLLPVNAPDSREVVERYGLGSSLPASVMQAVNEVKKSLSLQIPHHTSHVLADNQSILEAAAEGLRRRGVEVEIAMDICEQPIIEGCEFLLEHIPRLLEQSRRSQRPAGLISGGEFACPVRGTGIGGRNLETALRCAIALDQRRNWLGRDSSSAEDPPHIVFLSAGTDGIDGNSEVAGAIADETTVGRGRAMGLDARQFLENSDAFNYFNALKDTVFTFPTGTNVRDLRILLVSA